jgi:hypothetical protein
MYSNDLQVTWYKLGPRGYDVTRAPFHVNSRREVPVDFTKRPLYEDIDRYQHHRTQGITTEKVSTQSYHVV